jgi:hypothetical protein
VTIVEWLQANVGKKIRFQWLFTGNAEFPDAFANSDDETGVIGVDTCKLNKQCGASISVGHCYYCLSADEVAASECTDRRAFAKVMTGSGNVFHCVIDLIPEVQA